MMQSRKIADFLLILVIGVALSACGLPRSGPTEKEILASSTENGGDVHIVDVTSEVARAARRNQTLGFGAAFLSAGAISVDTIYPGDVLSITIWENISDGVFATAGQKVTPLEAIRVDQMGNIYVPYAGTIRASGRTPADLRETISNLLAAQTPDPQVEVRRISGEGATVSILGGVTGQGVFPIEISTRRLTGMIAAAGGISLDPSVVKITIRRRENLGSIWMQDLFDNSSNDIALHGGDRIFIEQDERYFISLGATGQSKVNFETKNPSAIEALALIGGLNANTSNPRGIFVFRVESAETANRILGRDDITTPQKFAYLIDLTQDAELFTAREFEIESEDTIYVTEAPYVAWQKILGSIVGSLNTFSSIDNAVTTAGEIF